MKSKLILAILLGLLFVAIATSATNPPRVNMMQRLWRLDGTAKWQGNKIVLTPDEGDQVGSAWSKNPVDLTGDMYFKAKIYLGNKDDDGADGIALLLTGSTQTEIGGEGIGYAGLLPSCAIEIDTYPNDADHFGSDLGDPLDDHIAITRDGNPNHNEQPDAPLVAIDNIEDGKEHVLLLTWTAESKTLSLFIDDMDTPKLEYTGELFTQPIADNQITFGLTSSTGSCSNLQYIIPLFR